MQKPFEAPPPVGSRHAGAGGIGEGRAEKPAIPDVSTRLALERTYLALERTLEAWIRTALSMVSFGFTLGKLVQLLHEDQVQGLLGTRSWSITSLAYFLVTVGVVALVGATVQHWFRVRQLYATGLPRQFSIALVVALLVSVVGAFAFTALVLEL